MKYTNRNNLPAELAVALVAGNKYVHSTDPNTISVTTLLKSIRMILLESRIPLSDQTVDVSTMFHSHTGTCIHDSLEYAWKSPDLPKMLTSLGYPESVSSNIQVNPEESEVDSNSLTVYTEQRTKKQIMGWTISGQFDLIVAGKLKDLKTTSVNKVSGDHRDYIMQLSIYRWLVPEKATEDTGSILFWLKDWSQFKAYNDPTYPMYPIVEKDMPLKSLNYVENYIRGKLTDLEKYHDVAMENLPECTPEELWQKPPAFKYYSKPDSKRASKVFTNAVEAQAHLNSKGKGLIKTAPSEPVRCKFCPVAHVCNQAQRYIDQGILRIN